MNRYLIFRTDRIGDFHLTAILVNAIKKNDTSAQVSIVASKKNFDYIKNFKLIDEVILLKNNILDRFVLINLLRKRKFKNIIVHDDKKRSHFITLFLKHEKKIIIKNKNVSHIGRIRNILNELNFKFFNTSLDTLEDKKGSLKLNDFIQLHFDEKWIHSSYIKSYIKIEPKEQELLDFLKSLLSKTKRKIVITTGINAPSILKNVITKINNDNILYYENLDFSELENVVINTKTLISCHGAISHVATAKSIKQIDIIDKSYTYNIWNEHFRNYNYLYRKKFSELANDILKLL